MTSSIFMNPLAISLVQAISLYGLEYLRGIAVYDITRGDEPLYLYAPSLESAIEIERQIKDAGTQARFMVTTSLNPLHAAANSVWVETSNLVTIPSNNTKVSQAA